MLSTAQEEDCLSRVRRRIVSLKVASVTGVPEAALQQDRQAILADARAYLELIGLPEAGWGVFARSFSGTLVYDINLVTELRKLAKVPKSVQPVTQQPQQPLAAAEPSQVVSPRSSSAFSDQSCVGTVAFHARDELPESPAAPPVPVVPSTRPPTSVLSPAAAAAAARYFGGKVASYLAPYQGSRDASPGQDPTSDAVKSSSGSPQIGYTLPPWGPRPLVAASVVSDWQVEEPHQHKQVEWSSFNYLRQVDTVAIGAVAAAPPPPPPAAVSVAPARLPFPGYVPANASTASYTQPSVTGTTSSSSSLKTFLHSVYEAAAPSLYKAEEAAMNKRPYSSRLTEEMSRLNQPAMAPSPPSQAPLPASPSLDLLPQQPSPLPTRALTFASPRPVPTRQQSVASSPPTTVPASSVKHELPPWSSPPPFTAPHAADGSFALTPVGVTRVQQPAAHAQRDAPPLIRHEEHVYEHEDEGEDESMLLPEVGPLDVTHTYLPTTRRSVPAAQVGVQSKTRVEEEHEPDAETWAEGGEDPVPYSSPATASPHHPLLSAYNTSLTAARTSPPQPGALVLVAAEEEQSQPPRQAPGARIRGLRPAKEHAPPSRLPTRRSVTQKGSEAPTAETSVPVASGRTTRAAVPGLAASARGATSRGASLARAAAAPTTRQQPAAGMSTHTQSLQATSRRSSYAAEAVEEAVHRPQSPRQPSVGPAPSSTRGVHSSTVALHLERQLPATGKPAVSSHAGTAKQGAVLPKPVAEDPAAVAAAAAAARRIAQARAAAAASKLAEEKARAEREKEQRVAARFAARDARLAKFAARQAVAEVLREAAAGGSSSTSAAAATVHPPAPPPPAFSSNQQQQDITAQAHRHVGDTDADLLPEVHSSPPSTTMTETCCPSQRALATDCSPSLHTAQRLSPQQQRQNLRQLAASLRAAPTSPRAGTAAPAPLADSAALLGGGDGSSKESAPASPAITEPPRDPVLLTARLALLKAKGAGASGLAPSRASRYAPAAAASAASSQATQPPPQQVSRVSAPPPASSTSSLATVLETTALDSSIVDPDTLLDSLVALVDKPAVATAPSVSSNPLATLGDAVRAVLGSDAGGPKAGPARRRGSLDREISGGGVNRARPIIGAPGPAGAGGGRRPSWSRGGSAAARLPEGEGLLPGESFFFEAGGEGDVFALQSQQAAVLSDKGFIPMFSGL